MPYSAHTRIVEISDSLWVAAEFPITENLPCKRRSFDINIFANRHEYLIVRGALYARLKCSFEDISQIFPGDERADVRASKNQSHL